MSGASGVLGSALVKELAESLSAETELVGLVRSSRDAEGLRHLFGTATRRWRFYACDLTDKAQVDTLIRELPLADEVVGVHLAADVAWNKRLEDVAPINVQGSLNFARIVRETSRSARLIYGSTAYTHPTRTIFRNSYEESKALGEARIRAEFADLSIAAFRCSLVLGDSQTGAISRFHGFYPLLRYASAYAVPFWVCDDGAGIDMVPLDWTTAQLKALVLRMRSGSEVDDVVASAGAGCVSAGELVEIIYESLNSYRMGLGLETVERPPVISARRYDFLRRSMKVWGTGAERSAALRYFGHLMDVYRPYLCAVPGADVLAPKNVDRPPPEPRTYLRAVFDYWFDVAHPIVRAARETRRWPLASR
jgi:nucleoside-diphosphate-sugar epimerase